MTGPEAMLEKHSIVIRDGRILDVVPSDVAAARYAPAVSVDRAAHVLMPGLVNAQTAAVSSTARGLDLGELRDGGLLRIAEMLKSGTTCCCTTGFFPGESARLIADQGMRAVIGIPIAEVESPWARNPREYLTRALNFRDEWRGHPTLTTAFAPHAPARIGDETFGRIATLADELDAAILMCLHESRDEINESVLRHGRRPVQRLHALGLLTPALTAAHMVHVTAADIALAQRSGVAVVLCPESNLRRGHGAPPLAAWAASGLRLALGTGALDDDASLDLWSALKLLALLSHPSGEAAAARAWEALSLATRGGAAVLGVDAQIGTLERGKWADLCCIDLRAPAMRRDSSLDMAGRLAVHGGRDLVSDVWVAGRHLLDGGTLTRLDWQELAARTDHRAALLTSGEP